MRSQLCAFAAATIALGLSGCGLFGGTSSSGSVDTVALTAQTTDGETGTATLTDTASGVTQVALTTAGGTDTGVQSALMRTGACEAGGAIYQELNNVQGDSSITSVDVDLSSLTGSKYSIEVHSSNDVTVVTACGVIP